MPCKRVRWFEWSNWLFHHKTALLQCRKGLSLSRLNQHPVCYLFGYVGKFWVQCWSCLTWVVIVGFLHKPTVLHSDCSVVHLIAILSFQPAILKMKSAFVAHWWSVKLRNAFCSWTFDNCLLSFLQFVRLMECCHPQRIWNIMVWDEKCCPEVDCWWLWYDDVSTHVSTLHFNILRNLQAVSVALAGGSFKFKS